MLSYLINSLIRKNIFLYIFFLNFYKKYTDLFFFIERKKYSFLKNSQFKNVIDIGSNKFQTYQLMKKLNHNLLITCFDPFLENKSNKKNFKKIALGNFKGKKKIYMPYFKNTNLDSLNSFKLENINEYLDKYLKNTNIKIIQKKINVNKLDNYKLNSDFIKIDAEGFELEILEGSIKHIKKSYPIILIEKNYNFKKIKDCLKKLNYDAFKILDEKFVINRDYHEQDIFFLNKKSKFHKKLIIDT